jgi:plasmid stabilization system protein ParE
LKRLLEYPDSGRSIPEFPELPYRELIVPPYRFFYRVKDDVVLTVAVWYRAQLLEDPT